MTTGEQLVSISTLSSGTAIDHLINPSGEGGTGETIYVPFDSIEIDFNHQTLEGDLDIISINGDLVMSEISADLDTSSFTADILINIIDGDLT